MCRNGLRAYTSNQTTLLSEIRNLLAWDWKWEGAIASKKFKTSWKNLCHWIRLEKFKNKVYSKKLFEKYDPMAEIFSNFCRPLDAITPLICMESQSGNQNSCSSNEYRPYCLLMVDVGTIRTRHKNRGLGKYNQMKKILWTFHEHKVIWF